MHYFASAPSVSLWDRVSLRVLRGEGWPPAANLWEGAGTSTNVGAMAAIESSAMGSVKIEVVY